MSLLHPHALHHVTFKPIDPLGDGLREDILAEQAEPEAFVLKLKDRPDENDLVDYLKSITADIKSDNDEFTYSED